MKVLKVATFNVNSIRSRVDLVLDWLKKEKPDVLALQETKVPDDKFPRQAFESGGWNVVFKGQKSHHGVAVVSKAPVKNPVLSLYPGDPAAQARFIGFEYAGIKIFNTYIPQGTLIGAPQYKKKLEFFSDLKTFFRKHVKPETPALWIGDLNVAQAEIDLARPSANRDHVCFHMDARNALKDAMEGLWIDLFREKVKGPGHYTFWSQRFGDMFKKNVGWRVDLILGTRAMVPRLRKIWIDKKPREKKGASDHTFLAAEFTA